jgi:two-component system sensor histidine kinase MprB
MPDEMRQRILADLDSEVNELTALVNEIVAVASGGGDDQPSERLVLEEVAEPVAERVGRRHERQIEVIASQPAEVFVPRLALERAVSNLVENACKFDPSGEPIEIVVEGTRLTVLDRGPGVADAERHLIFDRLHRADDARALPGSGLGLSIVRDIVERCAGAVSVEARPGGGAAIGFTLPHAPPA